MPRPAENSEAADATAMAERRVEAAAEEARATPAIQEAVGVSVAELEALFALERVKGLGPQKVRELHDAGLHPRDVLDDPSRLPTRGKRGDSFRREIAALDESERELARSRAVRQILKAYEHGGSVLTYPHTAYPRFVLESSYPVPVLYARGALGVLNGSRAVACVGSRGIRAPYSELHRAFAQAAVAIGLGVVSGFALGADTIGHIAARDAGGSTVMVMPSGLDRPFPPENRTLWQELLDYPRAVFVSEFPFGTAAAALTLRRRNRLIVAFATGVLLSQTSAKGGAMNAYRFALEQKKPVATFAGDTTPDTSGNDAIAADLAKEHAKLLDGTSRSVIFPVGERRELWQAWLVQVSSSI
jgi:DNA protecting protein DprA